MCASVCVCMLVFADVYSVSEWKEKDTQCDTPLKDAIAAIARNVVAER